MPLEWIDYKEAVRLHCLGQVAYAFGSRLYELHGGVNARSGRQHRDRGQLDDGDAGQLREPGKPARRLRAAAQQRDAVPPRREPLHVLRRPLPVEPAFARPRAAVLPGRRRGKYHNRAVLFGAFGGGQRLWSQAEASGARRLVRRARASRCRSRCCARTPPACRSSGSTTRRRCGCTASDRSPTPSAAACMRSTAAPTRAAGARPSSR